MKSQIVGLLVLVAFARFAPAAILVQMTQNNAQVVSKSSAVTSVTPSFDNGGFGTGNNGADAAVYAFLMNTAGGKTVQSPFTESLAFSSTTSTFSLTSVTFNYAQFDQQASTKDFVNVGLSVNGASPITQSTTGGQRLGGADVLTWDLTQLATASQNLQSYTLTFTFSEQGSGNITEFDLISKQTTAALQGIAINGTASAAPEPAGLVMLGAAGASVLRRARRR